MMRFHRSCPRRRSQVPSQVGDFFHACLFIFCVEAKTAGLPQSLKINENPEIRKIYPINYGNGSGNYQLTKMITIIYKLFVKILFLR